MSVFTFLKTRTTEGLAFIILFLLFCLLSSIDLPGLKDGTQSGKFLVFSFFVLVLLVLYPIGLFRKQELKLNRIDMLLLILFCYILINRYVLQDIQGFSIRYYELSGLAVIYIVLRGLDAKWRSYLFFAVITGGIIQAVHGQFQLLGYLKSNHNVFNLTGSFFNPGPYAGYLASAFPAALGIYLYADELPLKGNAGKAIKYLSLTGVLTMLLILPSSASRASWIAVMISSLVLIFRRYHVKAYLKQWLNTSIKKGLAVFCLVSIVATTCLGIYYLKPDSGNGRLFIWKTSVNMIKDQPLTGIGFDRFKSAYMDAQADYFRGNINDIAVKTAGDVEYAFNEFIQFIAENGLLATIVLIALLFNVFQQKNTGNNMLTIAKAGLLSCAVFSLFSYPSQILPIKLNAVFYLAFISSVGCFKPLFSVNTQIRYFNFIKCGVLLLAMVVSFNIHVHLRRIYDGFKHWNDAYAIYQEGLYGASLTYYQKAYVVFSADGQFLMQYGKALSMAKAHQKALAILTNAQKYYNSTIVQIAKGDSYKALNQYGLAEDAYFTAWYMAPERFYPKYLLARLYMETSQRQKAILVANELLNKQVKIQSPAIEQIKGEMRKIIDGPTDKNQLQWQK